MADEVQRWDAPAGFELDETEVSLGLRLPDAQSGLIARFGLHWARRKVRRAESFIDAVASELHKSPDELLSDLEGMDSRRTALFDSAADDATGIGSDEHIKHLGRIVAQGLAGDDSELDEAMAFRRTVGALDPIHIRMMLVLENAPYISVRKLSDTLHVPAGTTQGLAYALQRQGLAGLEEPSYDDDEHDLLNRLTADG